MKTPLEPGPDNHDHALDGTAETERPWSSAATEPATDGHIRLEREASRLTPRRRDPTRGTPPPPRHQLQRSPLPCERLLTTRETAERLGVKRKTLYNWSSTWEVERRGPEPLRLGGRLLRYRESDVARYIDNLPRAT